MSFIYSDSRHNFLVRGAGKDGNITSGRLTGEPIAYSNERGSSESVTSSDSVDTSSRQSSRPAHIAETDAYMQQKQRLERLNQICSQRRSEYKKGFSGISPRGIRGKVFAFHDNIAFCRAFKSGTTFSIGLLSKLFNCSYDCYSSYAEQFRDLSTTQKIEYIQDKFSFFFVREPYQRLFSVYSNKFYLPKEFWTPVASDIAARYRTNPSKTSLTYGHDVMFHELIHYVIDTFENGEMPDKHVTPDYILCNPCVHNYSFVGKLETFSADWKYLTDTWTSMNYTKHLPNDEMKALLASTMLSPIKHLFATIEILKSSGIPVENLFRRTWSYYQIIGLISKKLELRLPGRNTSAVGMEVFTNMIVQAIDDSRVYGQEVSAQKREALLQAYSTVPHGLLERLRKALSMDCDLFGYDNRPDWVFNAPDVVTDFNYFKWL